MSNIDKSLEVIQRTKDGDDLDPAHLYLVQCVVNGNANEYGLGLFEEIYQQVMAGTYTRPWLQGVEHLTRDHEGYVYWKGQHIEHWCSSLAYSDEGKAEAQELARRCQLLEANGIPVECKRVIWSWPRTLQEEPGFIAQEVTHAS